MFELEFSKKKSRSIDNLGCSSGLHKKEITPKKNQMPERKGSLVELSASLNAKGKKKNINKSIDLGTKKISMQKFNEMGK